MTTRVQLVVAHPDDETFGCGSLLLHLAAAGAVTAVCCATRGEAGELRPGSAVLRSGLGAAREQELRIAAGLLGVQRVDLLDLIDTGMSGPIAPDSLVGAPFDQVVTAVSAQIADFEPDIVVTLDASDGHRDHARIRDTTLAAARSLAVPQVYLHSLPRSLMQQWFDVMAAEEPGREHLKAPATTLGTPEAGITTVIDTSVHIAARESAIKAHASQDSPFDALPEDLRRAFLASAHLQRVEPPWPGGPLETTLNV